MNTVYFGAALCLSVYPAHFEPMSEELDHLALSFNRHFADLVGEGKVFISCVACDGEYPTTRITRCALVIKIEMDGAKWPSHFDHSECIVEVLRYLVAQIPTLRYCLSRVTCQRLADEGASLPFLTNANQES